MYQAVSANADDVLRTLDMFQIFEASFLSLFLFGLCGLCLSGMVRRIWKLRRIYVWVEAGPSELGAMTPTSGGRNGAAAADTPMRWEMDPLAWARSRPALKYAKALR